MANAKKIGSDLDFLKISRLLNVLLQSDTTINLTTALTALSQIGYDSQKLRAVIFDGTSNKSLLQNNDISIDGTMGGATPLDTLVPSQKAVNTYVTAALAGISSGVVIRGSYTITASPASYPRGTAATAVNATQVGNGSGTANAIKAGNAWYVKGGKNTIGSGPQNVNTGDLLIALVDNAGLTDADWLILEKNDDSASTTVEGVVQLATQAETEAKTVTTKAVTPSGLVNFALKFQGVITGDGTTASFTITHGLGSRGVIVQVIEAQGVYSEILVEIERTTLNTVVVVFAGAPAVNTNYTVSIV